MRISTEFSKQRGTSALEASLAVIPVLLLCLMGLELVYAHQSKQLASLALQEAGRQASVTAADHPQVERAFALALSPLFTPAGQHANPQARQKATIERYRRLYDLPLWQLELSEVDVWDAKPHEYRAVQLDLLYLHEPVHSWVRKALQQSAGWLSASPNGLTVKAQQQGLVAMRMSRRVVIHASTLEHTPKSWPKKTEQQPQQGLNGRLPLVQELQAAPTPHNVRTSTLFSQRSDSWGKNFQPATLVPLKQESEKEDLCGVLLCCLP